MPIPRQGGGPRLIVIASDEEVAAARKRPYSSLSDLAKEKPKTTLLGLYALTIPTIPGLKLTKNARSEVIDAFRAGLASVPGVEPVTYTEARAFDMPAGKPILGSVYAAHPCADDLFYPIASFHHLVFDDKVAEASRLLRSLGATRLRIESIQGWDKSISANLTGQINGADVGAEARSTSTSASNLVFEETYENDRTPSIPRDLRWYFREPLWQELAKGRLEHGMRTFSLEATYDEDHNINAGLKMKLEKAGLDIGGAFREHVASTWKMTGTFNNIKPA